MSVCSSKNKYKFTCSLCSQIWTGDNLNKISKRVAHHWNENHHSDLNYTYKQFDEMIVGGHHVHENEHVIEKIPLHITSFDVMERLGQEDGFAVLDENTNCCEECLQIMNYVLDEESKYCKQCKEKQHIEQIQDNNYQLDTF